MDRGKGTIYEVIGKWEQRGWEIEATDDWERAEVLAGEGWELVSVTANPQREYGVVNTYFFKRQKWVEMGRGIDTKEKGG